MSKSSNFFGLPIYGQLIKSLDREKIVEMSRKHGGEKYVKSFDGYTHLLTMLYAVIQRFDSLREIETSMTAEVRKLHHVGIDTVPKRSTLSDANARRSEKFFEDVYRDLYDANKDILSSDSRRGGTEDWVKRLRIIDSTTVSLFSNTIFKGVGRHPNTGKKKGGIKVHAVIHANEGVPCDVQFTSAVSSDSTVMSSLRPYARPSNYTPILFQRFSASLNAPGTRSPPTPKPNTLPSSASENCRCFLRSRVWPCTCVSRASRLSTGACT